MIAAICWNLFGSILYVCRQKGSPCGPKFGETQAAIVIQKALNLGLEGDYILFILILADGSR